MGTFIIYEQFSLNELIYLSILRTHSLFCYAASIFSDVSNYAMKLTMTISRLEIICEGDGIAMLLCFCFCCLCLWFLEMTFCANIIS